MYCTSTLTADSLKNEKRKEISWLYLHFTLQVSHSVRLESFKCVFCLHEECSDISASHSSEGGGDSQMAEDPVKTVTSTRLTRLPCVPTNTMTSRREPRDDDDDDDDEEDDVAHGRRPRRRRRALVASSSPPPGKKSALARGGDDQDAYLLASLYPFLRPTSGSSVAGGSGGGDDDERHGRAGSHRRRRRRRRKMKMKMKMNAARLLKLLRVNATWSSRAGGHTGKAFPLR